MVSHVDRKQSKDASVQRMQSSVIIVTAVTKETICRAGPDRCIYIQFFCKDPSSMTRTSRYNVRPTSRTRSSRPLPRVHCDWSVLPLVAQAVSSPISGLFPGPSLDRDNIRGWYIFEKVCE